VLSLFFTLLGERASPRFRAASNSVARRALLISSVSVVAGLVLLGLSVNSTFAVFGLLTSATPCTANRVRVGTKGLKRVQYRLGLIGGFLARTGLDLISV
jgi:hypothetical protein